MGRRGERKLPLLVRGLTKLIVSRRTKRKTADLSAAERSAVLFVPEPLDRHYFELLPLLYSQRDQGNQQRYAGHRRTAQG
jgi:hypothetical protein